MKARLGIGDFPWTTLHPEKLPHLKKLQDAFLDLFASYVPKPSKNITGAYGYPVYEMDAPADSNEFEDRVKELHALTKKYKPPAAVVLLTVAPDPKEVWRARFLKPYYFADFVDEGPYREPLNPQMVTCTECNAPASKKVPKPLLVNKSVLKKYDVFHTSLSMIVVRPQVLELLKKAVGDQIEFGEVAIAGEKTKAKAGDRLFWVRPKHEIGALRRQKIGQRTCPKCKRTTPKSARMVDDAVKKNGRGLHDARAWVEHYGKGKLEIALVPEPDDDWPEIAMSGRLLARLKGAGVKGIDAFTGQLPAQALFSERGEPVLEAEAAGSQSPAKTKESKQQSKVREQMRREMAALKAVPWDCGKDGHVYFQLSTPQIVLLDPMTGEEDSDGPHKVAKFAGPGLYRIPVTGIIEADDGGVAVDSASLLFVDNAFLADLVETYDWDQATTKSGSYDPKYQQQVADRIGIRFGICSTPPRRFKSQFVGDGCYTIDARKIEFVKQRA